MQGFTIFLTIAAVIFSCGPQFSVAAPSQTLSVVYTGQNGQKQLPVILNRCQKLPEEAFAVMNTTPYIMIPYTGPACQYGLRPVLPGEMSRGRPILSVMIHG
ncbi:hypothetical protein BC943DRAFT_331980 [Umbelopsis sp. AD052]|nr:hypothetical protein BC943DRAFT_331980 [Umbelopsis sp. AD052]